MHLLLWFVLAVPLAAQEYDLVIANGRILDPASGLDAARSVGINAGKIAAISEAPISGRRAIDAKGLVVAPGFIDLHSHGQTPENYRLKARDGVMTTAPEMEWAGDGMGHFAGRRMVSRAGRQGADQLWR